MKRFMNFFSVFVLLLGLSGVANAISITYDFDVMADGNSYTSPYSDVIVYTFDGAPSLNWSGNGAIVSDTVSTASAPFGVTERDKTNYMTVPVTGGTGSITATLGAHYNYFGLWWGSVDSYNTLSFYNDAALVASFTGTSITSPNAANGNQTAPSTNLYVNFLDLPAFNKFVMTSTQYAFEADNIAVGNVPIPAAAWLLGSGLIGLVAVRRRFNKK